MNIQYYLILSLVLSFTLVSPALAESGIQLDLYYDTTSQALRLDRESSDPIKVQDLEIQGYEVYFTEDSLATIGIDPSAPRYTLGYRGFQSDYTWDNYLIGPVRDGAFELTIPYYAHARQVTITDSRGASLDVNLEPYSSCNQNYICEYESQETINSCPTDCTGSNITFSSETLSKLQAENGLLRDEAGTVLLQIPPNAENTEVSSTQTSGWNWDLIMLGVGIILIVGAVGSFGYRWLRSRQTQE